MNAADTIREAVDLAGGQADYGRALGYDTAALARVGRVLRGETKDPAASLFADAQRFISERRRQQTGAIGEAGGRYLTGRSVADLMDDDEAAAADRYRGLARIGATFVQRGFDSAGLMYAVEVAFYAREEPADTWNPGQFALTPSGSGRTE